MNEIQIFNNVEFGEIRTVMIEGDPWFIGKDIAERLGYGDGNQKSKAISNAIKDHVDEDDKVLVSYNDLKGHQNGDLKNISRYGAYLINESGLYSLVLRSKLESAKRFKKWVTSEVLPALRKTGKYAMSKIEGNTDKNSISEFLSMLSDGTKNAIIIDLSGRLANDEAKKAKRKETIRKRTEALKSLPDNIYNNRKKLREEILAFTKEFKTSAGKAYRDLYKILESEFGIKVVKGENKLYVESIPADKWDDVFKALDLMKNRNAA